MSALEKGFQIIGYVVSKRSDGASFTEIVDNTLVPKATVHRLLGELCGMNALVLDSQTRKYTGGLLLAQLGADVVAQFDIRRQMRAVLDAVHQETGYIATLGVRHEGQGVYLDKREAPGYGVKLHSEVGKQFPLHCTAMGKVMLAYAPDAIVDKVLSQELPQYTEKTITSAGKLRSHLRAIKTDGYAVDDEEITRGLCCVAVPVSDIRGNVTAAISVTFPSWVAQENGLDSAIEVLLSHTQDLKTV